jgi:hypothetical protein
MTNYGLIGLAFYHLLVSFHVVVLVFWRESFRDVTDDVTQNVLLVVLFKCFLAGHMCFQRGI